MPLIAIRHHKIIPLLLLFHIFTSPSFTMVTLTLSHIHAFTHLLITYTANGFRIQLIINLVNKVSDFFTFCL